MRKLTYKSDKISVSKYENKRIEMPTKLDEEFKEKFYFQNNKTKYIVSLLMSYVFNLFSFVTGSTAMYFMTENSLSFGLRLPIFLKGGIAVIALLFSVGVMFLVEVFKRNGVTDVYRNGWLLGGGKINYPTAVFNVFLLLVSVYMSYDGVTSTVNYTHDIKDTIAVSLNKNVSQLELKSDSLINIQDNKYSDIQKQIKAINGRVDVLSISKDALIKQKNNASKSSDWTTYSSTNQQITNVNATITDLKNEKVRLLKEGDDIKKRRESLEKRKKETITRLAKKSNSDKNKLNNQRGDNLTYMIVISLISELLLIFTVAYCIYYKYRKIKEIREHNQGVIEVDELLQLDQKIADLENEVSEYRMRERELQSDLNRLLKNEFELNSKLLELQNANKKLMNNDIHYQVDTQIPIPHQLSSIEDEKVDVVVQSPNTSLLHTLDMYKNDIVENILEQPEELEGLLDGMKIIPKRKPKYAKIQNTGDVELLDKDKKGIPKEEIFIPNIKRDFTPRRKPNDTWFE